KVVVNEFCGFVKDVNRIHQFTVNVELELLICGVANSDRTGFFISFEVSQNRFFEIPTSVDTVHDLERCARFQLAAALFDPASEGDGFAPVTQSHQPVESERTIANPGVAVIPVPNAADFFRQTERWRCDDGTIPL